MTLLDIVQEEATLHIVMRGNFIADGINRERGEVVDTSGWRNVPPLVRTRKLDVAPRNIMETLVECPCGRGWIDQFYADAHGCPKREAA